MGVDVPYLLILFFPHIDTSIIVNPILYTVMLYTHTFLFTHSIGGDDEVATGQDEGEEWTENVSEVIGLF